MARLASLLFVLFFLRVLMVFLVAFDVSRLKSLDGGIEEFRELVFNFSFRSSISAHLLHKQFITDNAFFNDWGLGGG